MIDADQFEVELIIAYRGNPITRTNMEFLVQFRDDKDPTWVVFSDDLFKTVYVDLRFYGADPNEPGENWYRFLSLLDLDSRNYVVPFTYGKFSSRNTRITVCCHIMGDIFAWDRCTVLE